ncbi:MAG TPA: BRCT domain-containing protein [Abditibacteriaceae bacterium]|nr:BRCT domain-containing protein [Abditibacteriaceae bacterium]
MEMTLSYARPSAATTDERGTHFAMSGESSRPPVSLQAVVGDSLGYARAMLALHNVVTSDLRFAPKDHTAYQQWVQARYWEDAGPEIQKLQEQFEKDKADASRLKGELNELLKQRDEMTAECKPIIKRLVEIESYAWWESNFWQMRRDLYTPLVHQYGAAALGALRPCDPVVSVHPDCVIFEVFSFDESSYGRVTVPMEKLETFGDIQYGTTNVDFSIRLADEFKRVRSYRPSWIQVEPGGVSMQTSAGAQFEKKIDLPPTWVRGFLQVQSASSLPGVEVELSPGLVADLLLQLRQQRERKGPRSLRFKLVPGQKPSVEIEPWGVVLQEANCVWNGTEAQEIRIWGRRRLFFFEQLLPHATSVKVKLLGSGMPSYWSIEMDGHRFDLGLSGWTQNDWSKAARFDVMAAPAPVSEGDAERVFRVLEEWRMLTPEEAADSTQLKREVATAALQQLCREGRAMYDFTNGVFRCRQLLPFPAPQDESDTRTRHASRLVHEGKVKMREVKAENASEFLERFMTSGVRLFEGEVKTEGGNFSPTIGLDADGRATFAQCSCGFYRQNKLRLGPCAHILAASVVAATSGGANVSADRFKNQTWVFTGALTLFTREQAEKVIEQGGGTAAGSVSKNTNFLVAGERAGSKLAKAKELGIPVLTETEFKAILDGKDAPQLATSSTR